MTHKYLGFPLPEDLDNRAQEVINEIKASNNKRQYALKLFQLISDLSDIGLDYFFIQSLKRAGLGRIKMIAIENAIKIGKKAILSVGKGIIKSMSDDQLLIIANIIEESMLVRERENA